jgi:hypothetical protein
LPCAVVPVRRESDRLCAAVLRRSLVDDRQSRRLGTLPGLTRAIYCTFARTPKPDAQDYLGRIAGIGFEP